MAVKLTHVRKITSNETLNTYQLVLDTLFGGKMPEDYNPEKTYIKGDAIIIKKDDGKYYLQVMTNDDGSTTGPYNPEDWTTTYFTDLFREGSALDIDFSKATQISHTRPTDKDNVTWYQPVNVKDIDGSNIDIGGNADHGIIIVENEHFAAQPDTPKEPNNVRLWLDYEEDDEK